MTFMWPAVLMLLVKASVILAAAAAVMSLSRRSSAARRHMTGTIAVIALLALPIFVAALPALRIPVLVSEPVARIAAVIDHAATSAAVTRNEAPLVLPSMRRAPGDEPTTASPVAAPNSSAPSPLSWSTILIGLYLAGVLSLMIKLVIERAAVSRLSQQTSPVSDGEWLALLETCRHEAGVTDPVRLLRSLDRAMPMAFGVVRPSILIPSIADTWTLERRRAVLLHELAHIARRDCLTQLVTRIACALYWPHPGSWLMARRLRMERELACDDRVLAIGTAAPDYAQHLLELAYSLGGYRAPALVVSMARPKQLEGRMLAVLDNARNRTTPAVKSRIAAFIIAGLVVAPLAAAEFSSVTEVSTVIAEDGAAFPEAVSAASPTPSPAQGSSERTQKRREIQLPGTWQLRTSDRTKALHLQLSERPNSMSGFTVRIEELVGLSASALSGPSGAVKFSLRREAGTLNFEGTVRSGVGAGTFDFTPSQTFAAEMAKRGYDRPTNDEMYVLARNDIGTSFLDELNAQKYTKPTLDELLRAGDHGVDLDYLHDMGGAGYHLGQVSSLIKTRDHGVDLEFVNGLKSHGLGSLTVDELVRARDHGVDPEYIGGMKQAGFDMHDLEGLVRTRDHGVDPAYVAEMKGAGYDLRDIDGLVRARDHGVDAGYIHGMGALGFKKLPLEHLIKARDHGVDVDYVTEMRHHGYNLDLEELISGRDHGVDEEFAGAWIAAGYKDLTINELVRLRDNGVTASWAKRQNSGRSRMTIEELVRRRNRGGN